MRMKWLDEYQCWVFNKEKICANVKKYRELNKDKLRVYKQSRKDIDNERRRARNRKRKEELNV